MLLSDGEFYGHTIRQAELEHFQLTLTVYTPGEVLPRHHHENPYLSLLLQGNYMEAGGREDNVIAGGYSIFRPGDHAHANRFDKQAGKCLNLELKPGITALFGKAIQNGKAIILKRSFLELFLLHYRFVSGHPADTLDILSFEIISQLFEQDRPAAHGRAAWIQQVTDRIQEEPAERYTVESIAAAVNVHPVYLLRKFKEKTGLRLSEYISRARLEKAVNNMAAGEGTLTQVAHGSGFYDQSHFNRAFREYFGAAPRQFSKTIKG